MMKNEPLVGIAIPVYNGGKYLRECLEHIVDQTYTNWVCYITDNASEDDTNAIAQEFVDSDKRFRLFRNDHTIRAYENFNMAYYHLSNVEGLKYSLMFPADDWMFPTCIEKKISVMEQSEDIGMCLSYSICGSEVIYTGVLDYNKGNVFDGKQLLHDYLKYDMYMVGNLGTPIYRVSELMKIDPCLRVYNEYNIHCDVELANDIMRNNKVGMVFEILNYYRIHEGQGLTFARKFNTDLYGHEVEFTKHMNLFDDMDDRYRQHRLNYALFILKMRKENNQEVLAWHQKYLDDYLHKEITTDEFRSAVRLTRRVRWRELYHRVLLYLSTYKNYLYFKSAQHINSVSNVGEHQSYV